MVAALRISTHSPDRQDLTVVRNDIFYLDGFVDYLGTEIIRNRAGDPCVLFRNTPNGPVRYLYVDGFFLAYKANYADIDFHALDEVLNHHSEAKALLIKVGRDGIYYLLKEYD